VTSADVTSEMNTSYQSSVELLWLRRNTILLSHPSWKMTSEVGSFNQRAFHQFRSFCCTGSLIFNTENYVKNEYYKHGLHSDIFVALKELGCKEHSGRSYGRRLDGPKFCLSNVFIGWD
jgi:hypothetical protein